MRFLRYRRYADARLHPFVYHRFPQQIHINQKLIKKNLIKKIKNFKIYEEFFKTFSILKLSLLSVSNSGNHTSNRLTCVEV